MPFSLITFDPYSVELVLSGHPAIFVGESLIQV